MSFRKIAIALIPIMFLTSCISVNTPGATVGNGRMVDGSFITDGSPITEIIIENVHATVNIDTVSSNVVTYTIDENLQNLLQITHQGGTLRISTTNNRSVTSRSQMVFSVGTDVLEQISVSGAVTINGNGKLTVETFALDIAGAASVNLELDASAVSTSIAGAGSLTLSGTTDELFISAAGAASINARSLVAQDATVSISGAGSAQVHAENTLDVSVAGVGSVTYWGDPVLTSSAPGLASVRKGN